MLGPGSVCGPKEGDGGFGCVKYEVCKCWDGILDVCRVREAVCVRGETVGLRPVGFF